MKLILLVVLVLGLGALIVLLEQYSAGRGLEQFLGRTRLITIGMSEKAVVDALGSPAEINRLADNDREHGNCRAAGGSKIFLYRYDYRGWFHGLGMSTGWDQFLVCLNPDGHVVQTDRVMIHVRGQMSVRLLLAYSL